MVTKQPFLATNYEGTVQADTPYTYYIVAFDYDGNFAQRTNPLVLPDNIVVAEDTQAPSVPADVAGTWDVSGDTARHNT